MSIKNDSVCQVWCKRTTLATIAQWYVSGNVFPRSKSELIRLSLEKLEELIVKNGGQVFTSTSEANTYLVSVGLDISERANPNLLRNLQFEENRNVDKDMMSTVGQDGTFSAEMLEEATRKFKEAMKGEKK